MEYFKTAPLANGVTLITDLSGVFFYLVEGKEKAALIDSGTGIGNLAEFVKTMTDKPLTVLITHVHPDHAGNIYTFADEQVFIPEKDLPDLNTDTLSYETRRGYYMMMKQIMDPQGSPCPDEMIVRCRDIRPQTVQDHDVFDLGGRSLEAVAMPGHTFGSTAYLDRTNRMIFMGDAANQNTLLCCETSDTLENYYHALQRLKGMEGTYDIFLICHGAPLARKSTVDDLLALCEEVMAAEKQGRHVGTIADGLNPYGDGRRIRETDRFMNRLDGGTGNLVYRPANVWNK